MAAMYRLTIFLCLAYLLQAGCSLDGCQTCTTALVGSQFVETCTSCGTGFQVGADGKCEFDVGLVVGVGIGAIAIIALQIGCFCFCRMYFKEVQKKKMQYTLQDIFEQLQKERNDPATKHQLQQKYQPFHDKETLCYYCKNFPEDQLEFEEQKVKNDREDRRGEHLGSNSASNQIIDESQQDSNYDCPAPNPRGPTLRLACEREHYYHLPCLKKLLIKKPKKCICSNTIITPFYMICVDCKLKHRQLKLDISQDKNVMQIKDYICAICFKKKKDKENQSKWWKKCC